MDESVRAAYCELMHGDPNESDEVRSARQGEGDLIARTWHKDIEMTRDQRRLMTRYEKTIDASSEASLAAYRKCSICSGSPIQQEKS